MSPSITTLRAVLSPVLRRSIPVTSRSLRRTYDPIFSLTTESPLHSSHPPYSTISKTSDSVSDSSSESESESKLKLKPDLKKLKHKTVLITGATRGIGRAIAERFASEGARCLLVGRDEVRLRGVREGLMGWDGSGGGERGHEVLVGDVGRKAFWGREFEKDIDILVNAAGITHYSLLATTKKELLDEVVQTNLMGTVWGCQVVGKGMMRRRSGCIINVASLLGVKGGRGSTVYAASKAGVIALTRSLASEVGSMGIRVNVIVPGYIETDMTTAMTPEARTQALKDIPLNRFGYTSEIADAAVFLATNAYANNCILNIDGGLSAT